MENTNNKLLQALRKHGADKIFDAYNWLQEHRHEFNKEVYGPVLLEVLHTYNICLIFRQFTIMINLIYKLFECKIQVTVADKIHAGYLEGHVPPYIWKVISIFHCCSAIKDLVLFSNLSIKP